MSLKAGCSYFVTQVVYDVNAAKNLVSDYAYECRDRGLDPIDREPRPRGQSRDARGGPLAQGRHDPPPDLAIGSLEGLLLPRGGRPPDHHGRSARAETRGNAI